MKTNQTSFIALILGRIREVLTEEEEAHSRFAELFMEFLDGVEADSRNDAFSGFVEAMQSFDSTKQRIFYLTKLAEKLSTSSSDDQIPGLIREVGRSPLECDAIWLDGLIEEIASA